MRTGSLLPPIASHVFCNIMGLPGFASDLQQYPQKRICESISTYELHDSQDRHSYYHCVSGRHSRIYLRSPRVDRRFLQPILDIVQLVLLYFLLSALISGAHYCSAVKFYHCIVSILANILEASLNVSCAPCSSCALRSVRVTSLRALGRARDGHVDNTALRGRSLAPNSHDCRQR